LKFRTIFIVSNIIILLFLAFVCILPYFILGDAYKTTFFFTVLPLLVIPAALLAGFYVYYFKRKRLFALLEREDYPALVQYLDGEIFQRGKYSKNLVKILANAYLVLSDPAAVIDMEQRLSLVKPDLVEANVLLFGAARILAKNPASAESLFAKYLNNEAPKQEDWLRFYHGLSCFFQKKYDPAVNEFIILINESAEPAIIGISSYLLEANIVKNLPRRKKECLDAAGDGKSRVNKYLPTIGAWSKYLTKLQNEVHVSMLSKYSGRAASWLYAGEEP
jgi:hypothetical protein